LVSETLALPLTTILQVAGKFCCFWLEAPQYCGLIVSMAARCLGHWVDICAERLFGDNSALAVAYKRAEDACAAIKGEENASSYTGFLLLFKKELPLGDKKTAAVDFKMSLVFGFEDSSLAACRPRRQGLL
ncbi:hypothetical protein PR002_g12727, partial [Phytophthora rubi]